jgi:ketosteroid isomerase-like protein
MVTADNENERLVLKWFDRLSAGDFPTLRALLHPQATWTLQVKGVQGAGAHEGPKGIVDDFLMPVRLGLFREGDPKLPVESMCSKGPLVAVETRGVGQMKNGTHYDNRYCWVVEVKDGKVFAVREYMDSYYVSTLS